MKPGTVEYLLRLLDSQHAHIATEARRSKAAGERQRIYYTGVMLAVNAAISEAYTAPVAVWLRPDGSHSLVECPALRTERDEIPAF